MPELSDINPFGSFDIGVGAVGNALILFAIAVVILGLVGWLIYWQIEKRRYNKIIPLYKSINGKNYKQATYKAKVVPISKAGDSLWFVKGIKKFLAPATETDAPNSYPHEERDDGEWINFSIDSVNDKQKIAGVKFIHQDMRTQRVATGQILEQRLINKSFWEKYKDMIVHLVFYIIVVLCMIVIFWQWSDITDKVGGLVSQLNDMAKNINELQRGVNGEGIVPALSLLFSWRFWKK